MAEDKASVQQLLSPEDWENRQIDTLSKVGRKNYETGIKAPDKDPIEEGIAKEERYAEKTREAIDEGRRKEALQATDMATWFKYASEIGAGNLVSGVKGRRPEVTKFVESWQPILADHKAKIADMAAVTDADMEDRMLENLRGLRELKGDWR